MGKFLLYPFDFKQKFTLVLHVSIWTNIYLHFGIGFNVNLVLTSIIFLDGKSSCALCMTIFMTKFVISLHPQNPILSLLPTPKTRVYIIPISRVQVTHRAAPATAPPQSAAKAKS